MYNSTVRIEFGTRKDLKSIEIEDNKINLIDNRINRKNIDKLCEAKNIDVNQFENFDVNSLKNNYQGNCFRFVLGTGDVPQKLQNLFENSEVGEMKKGSVAIYIKKEDEEERIVHVGVVDNKLKVVSKWGWELPIFRHNVDMVPTSYGQKIIYLERKKQQILDLSLKSVLIEATLSEKVAIRDGIERMRLEDLAEESEKLSIESLRDINGEERAMPLYVTHDKKMLTNKEVFVGKKTETGAEVEVVHKIWVNPDVDLLPRFMRQNKFLATVMHSHGALDLPPSASDLQCLFRNKYSPVLAPCVFVATTSSNLIVFRGQSTPHWDDEYLDQQTKEWNEMLLGKIENHNSCPKTVLENIRINASIQNDFISQLAKEHNLYLYQGELGENEIRRVEKFSFEE